MIFKWRIARYSAASRLLFVMGCNYRAEDVRAEMHNIGSNGLFALSAEGYRVSKT
ncbi:MAG: hypothetical protein II931_05485 [Clostridia bacterium]|nr:hypothetical protein [Clostridia bacterium]